MTSRFLTSILKNTTRLIGQMSEAPVLINKPKYNGKIKKRNWEERRSNEETMSDEKRQKIEVERVKRRKFALLLGYSGVDYYGMQRNPQMKTIEEDLLSALLKVRLINDEAFSQVQTIQFQRAARTDKGVSAARQLVSLKLPEKYDISQLNENLPEAIRVFSIKRVTKGFNSKSNCDARTYTYMLPTLAFAPFNETVVPETFRLNDDILNKVNEILNLFCGSKNFHNFTSKKKFRDPSALRYIISFECQKPFVRKDMEFTVIQVKGQSFMLHQIRKMIGLTIAVIRGHTTTDTISKSWTSDRLDIPMAPGLGLVLEYLHYDRYNERFGSDHDTMEWTDVETEITDFKEKHIYPTIVDTEIKEKSMISWLETLPYHTFDVRNQENGEDASKDSDTEDNKNDSDDEELNNFKKRKGAKQCFSSEGTELKTKNEINNIKDCNMIHVDNVHAENMSKSECSSIQVQSIDKQ